MPSFVWDRDIEEAYVEPYEYGAQEQFSREAKKVLTFLKNYYSRKNHTFSLDDRSREKAIWLLQVDGLDTLIDILNLIDEKKRRAESILFRSVLESLDLSFYFLIGGRGANSDLLKWYADEIVSHGKFRDFMKGSVSKDISAESKKLYKDLSKYTHRSYRAILKSYSKDQNNLLIYDGFIDSDILIPPQIISFSYALLGKLVRYFMEIAQATNQIDNDVIKQIWELGLEEETVPRRFGEGPGQMMRVSSNEFGGNACGITKVKKLT